jgi:hypothetical protein
MSRNSARRRATVVLTMFALLVAGMAGTTQAREEREGGESESLLARAEYEASKVLSPGRSINPGAFGAASAAASALPVTGGAWDEVTDLPTQNDDPRYADPIWSNTGAGWFLVGGRMTALETIGGALYAGAAEGGVWKSTDRGGHWVPWYDGLPRLAVGSLAVNPSDRSLWVGLGEANTAFENFTGQGVYRLAAGARRWTKVGSGDQLANTVIYRVRFDGAGHVYVATNRGLYRRDAGDLAGRWRLVLKPDPNPSHSPYRTSHITDVIPRPGTGGRVVLAVLGWRGGTLPEDLAYNGFYVSGNGGVAGSFRRVTPSGDIAVDDIGRTTLASGGSRLYAVIESPGRLAQPDVLQGGSNLLGVYLSRSGDPRGPWEEIADPLELARSGSALLPLESYPGVQAWYNQYILVDPTRPDHVYVGLEEVFETVNAGRTWNTAGPYWNFTRPCYQGGLHDCRPTVHPDQHAITFAYGEVWVGSDGGVWHRPMTNHSRDAWVNTNRTLHTLQYYYAGIGKVADGDAIWGGTQDNGTILKHPRLAHQVIPQGGDGGDVIVDPNNGDRAVVEYVNLDMALTTNGGRSDGTTSAFREISPSCTVLEEAGGQPCDPAARFIAPFEADLKQPNRHWVAGGQYIWETRAGWNTECTEDTCDWKITHDLGEGRSASAFGVSGNTVYAGWCYPGPGCNPGMGVPFRSGIDTNYGGRWHRINAPNLPNRLVNSFAVDPGDPAHVYAVYGAFSRRWLPGGGQGHVFESRNGGATWRDISGNLPDIPVEDLVIGKGRLVAGTHIGAFLADADRPTSWARLGRRLPNVAIWDLTLSPDRSYLLAATHGLGLWKIGSP